MSDPKFKPGKPKTGGRQKGTPNKKTREFMLLLEEENFEPGAALIHCYKEAMKLYDRRREHRAFGAAVDALKLASGIAEDIAQFAYPKKKAIEHSGEVGVKTFADFIAAAAKAKENK